MLPTEVNIAAFGVSDTATAFDSHPVSNSAAQKSQYAILLRAPMSSLASSASDGADAYSAAILGYN
ncbi:hypothetical protein [Trinickia sp. EG282A]|uniref:hypothetical protein n=1 Tax=Trinickia sp. EG282A TaxID=3237013 RepID=UPI0034D1CD87